jgi:hypothetical protein
MEVLNKGQQYRIGDYRTEEEASGEDSVKVEPKSGPLLGAISMDRIYACNK